MSYPCGDRYHVAFYVDGVPELECMEATFARALGVAQGLAKQGLRAEIYDVMARRGYPQLWDANGTVLATRRA